MAMIIKRIRIAVDKVISIHIIDISIAIIVNEIICNFSGIYPHVAGKVFVPIIHTSIDDRNNDIGITCIVVPGFRRIDIGIEQSTALLRIV